MRSAATDQAADVQNLCELFYGAPTMLQLLRAASGHDRQNSMSVW